LAEAKLLLFSCLAEAKLVVSLKPNYYFLVFGWSQTITF